MHPQLSILIVSQSMDLLTQATKALAKSQGNLDIEVLCAWNGVQGPDQSQLKDLGFPFHLFEMRPYDFSGNNNQLARQAKGTYLLFLNDDVIVDQDCLHKALAAFDCPDTGIVGINLRYPDGRVQHAGVVFDDLGNPKHRYKQGLYYQDPRVTREEHVLAVTGAFLMVRRDEFLQLMFDESCTLAGQDVLFCLHYRQRLHKNILYAGQATAVHDENGTRRQSGKITTPDEDLHKVQELYQNIYKQDEPFPGCQDIRLRIVTEEPGWIMHRMAQEIAQRLPNAVINQDYEQANIHYYINYGYLQKRPPTGLVVACFTHFDPEFHADRWLQVAQEADHCVAISNKTAEVLLSQGIPEDRISVIITGADRHYRPKLTLGLVGRTYQGGRKGEHLVSGLLQDQEIMENVRILASNDSWGVSVREFEDMADFYRSIDYLLIPSLIEGGPVPFMEALACGTLSIAPPIGVVPDYPHIEYKTGNIDSLKKTIKKVKKDFLASRRRISHHMETHDWKSWAWQHTALFKRLLDSD